MAARLLVTFEIFEDQRHNLSKDDPNEFFATVRRGLGSSFPDG